MSAWYIISIISGIIAILICSIAYVIPNRKVLIMFRLAFDLVSAFNCLSVYFATSNILIMASLANSGIGVFRDIIFYYRKDKKWANSYWWLVGFEICFFSTIFFTYRGPLSLLPIIGGMINTFALYLIDSRLIKSTTLVGQIFFIVYYSILISGTDFLTILNLIASSIFFVAALIGLLYLLIKKEKHYGQ